MFVNLYNLAGRAGYKQILLEGSIQNYVLDTDTYALVTVGAVLMSQDEVFIFDKWRPQSEWRITQVSEVGCVWRRPV